MVIDQLEGSSHYHIPSVLKLKGTLNRRRVTAGFTSIVTVTKY